MVDRMIEITEECKMKKWFLSLCLVPALLAGCGDEVDTNLDGSGMMEPIEVTILNEEQFEVGTEVELAAQVTQGDEFVDDAEEVKFEVWESGLRAEGVMLDGKLTKDGTYVVNHAFDHDGVYYMFAHTTARGMHVMPKMKLIVGNPDMSKVLEDNSSNSMDHNKEDHDGEE